MTINHIIETVFIVWNVIVFGLYGVDKIKAIRGAWRISEKTLLLTTIFGGGIGAVLAATLFRHKIRKYYFWMVWILGLVIDGYLIGTYFRIW